jgi:hypothetical protein
MKCEGCECEMDECYLWQTLGYDAGLDWEKYEQGEEHCKLFVLNKEGEFIVR